MKWENREESQNVEDVRGRGKTGMAIGGGAALLILLLGLLFGVDPQKLLQVINQGPGNQQQVDPNAPQRPRDPVEERLAHFTKVIFHDTEVVWEEQFQKMGKQYRKPTLVLYTDEVRSGCGTAESSVGPFYCPADEKVYIDLAFYRDMEKKLDAPGEFARAYVIAHEVGHHVQKLLGYSQRVDAIRQESTNKTEINHASVRLELQADFLAGVWAYHGQKQFKFLEKGDIQSALHAAFEIGDDRLQKRYRGTVRPDSFTHGTSQQRTRWFEEGFDTGDVHRARQLFDRNYNEL